MMWRIEIFPNPTNDPTGCSRSSNFRCKDERDRDVITVRYFFSQLSDLFVSLVFSDTPTGMYHMLIFTKAHLAFHGIWSTPVTDLAARASHQTDMILLHYALIAKRFQIKEQCENIFIPFPFIILIISQSNTRDYIIISIIFSIIFIFCLK